MARGPRLGAEPVPAHGCFRDRALRCTVTELGRKRPFRYHSETGSEEDDVAMEEISLTIDGPRVRLRNTTLCTFSLHALGRRIERGLGHDDLSLMTDMDAVADVDRAKLDAGGLKVTTDPRYGGGWRGRVTTIATPGKPTEKVLSIRTWLES